MATVQSIIDRAKFVTKDTDGVRWTLEEMILWIIDAIDLIAEAHPRAASQYVTLTLSGGSRQDLRAINPSVRWVRLQEILCNVVGNEPNGPTVRQISRPALDYGDRAWRSRPQRTEIKEYALDEREPFTFDVNPPAVAGTQLYALAAVKPAPIADEDAVFPLADGYDIPVVDYLLFRLFSKDASDPAYTQRAAGHLQAFNLALNVVVKDASA